MHPWIGHMVTGGGGGLVLGGGGLVRREVDMPPPPPPPQVGHPLPPRIGHWPPPPIRVLRSMHGQYASYWNAYLLLRLKLCFREYCLDTRERLISQCCNKTCTTGSQPTSHTTQGEWGPTSWMGTLLIRGPLEGRHSSFRSKDQNLSLSFRRFCSIHMVNLFNIFAISIFRRWVIVEISLQLWRPVLFWGADWMCQIKHNHWTYLLPLREVKFPPGENIYGP